MASRLNLLAEAKTKYLALAALQEIVDGSHGTLIFTQTKDSARRAQDLFTSLGTTACALYSGMDRDERRQGMDQFRSGASQILAAPRLLDEGIDVPAADFGVIVAASRSQRQMVQRLGRVIRKKNDSRVGRLAVLYSKGTVEDPDVQGEEFLGKVLPFARNVDFFDIATEQDRLIEFLRPETIVISPQPDTSTVKAAQPVPEPQVIQEVEAIPAPESFDLGTDLLVEELSGVDGLTDDPVKDYLRRIGRVPLLSAEQEVRLAQEIEAGVFGAYLLQKDIPRSRKESRELRTIVLLGERAAEALMAANLRLVVSIAKRYAHRGLELLDLIQEGNLGLHRAVCKFDFKQGHKFSTYATWWIRQSITRALADQGRLIRLPVHVVEQLMKVLAAQRKCLSDGTTVDVAYLSKETGIPIDKVNYLLRLDKPILSLDLLVSNGRGGSEPMREQMVDPDALDAFEEIANRQMTDAIYALLDTLTEREASVIAMRFGFTDGEGKTLDEIGKVFGVTRERIRQIERATMEQIKDDAVAAPLKAFRYGLDSEDVRKAAEGSSVDSALDPLRGAR
ncbi:sigma-70 family RNA polymerase sigma factor [Pseudarthrobacter sp. J1738]|uniref:sigma-70 family RNA polymerase sigma factor n=1 Tax=Pseudarthrobacter sp. J1738 TaxID=3420446 RepID=UPI003D2C668B